MWLGKTAISTVCGVLIVLSRNVQVGVVSQYHSSDLTGSGMYALRKLLVQDLQVEPLHRL